MKPFLLPFLLLLGSLSLPAQLIKDPLFPPSDPPTRPGAPIELCIGNSTPGYAYRLLRNGALVESRQGTGSTICFSGNLSGTYSVTAFDGFVTMPIVSDLLIGHFLSRLTPAFDPARPDIPISFTLADSRIGYRYTLFRNGEAIQELSGTGSPLVFEGNFRGGSYKVGFRYGSGNGFPHLGTNEWWYTGTASATVEVATTGLYAFTCSDSRVFPGLQVEFRLEGSDSGTHYTLWRNGSPLAGGLNGTGGALVFKDVYPAGSYRLRATPPTGPAFDMDGVIVLQDYDIVKLDYQFLMHEFIKFESQPDGWSVQIRLESLPGDLTAPLYPDPNPNDRVLEIGYVPVSRETAWQLWGEFEEIAAAYNAGRVAGWDPAFQIDVNLLHKFLTITVPLNLSSQPRAAVFALVNQSDVNQAEYGRKSIPIRQAGGGELKRYSLEAPTAVQPGRSYSVTLLGSQVGVSYSLYRDGLLAGTKTGKGEEVAFTGLTGFGTYSVVAEYQEQTLSMDNTVTVHDPATLPNYIHTKTFNGGEYAADITFFDGLGRPMQQVGLNAAAGGKDLVTPIAYDLQGREDAKAYLPYARERGNSAYDPVALSAQFAWYGNQYPGEGSYAFQENHYETSLLNRVLYSIQPGRGVRDAAKKAAYGYRTNPANSVRLFRMQADGTLLADGYYPHGTLYEATVTNEDGTTTHTFTDKWENIVLERAVFSDNGQEKVLDTYRVYNPEGRLAYVISPEGAAQLSTPGVFPSTNDVLCRYTCRYEYDAFGRMTLRRLPGAEEEYYVYDRDDRLVLYQDSKLRTGGSRWKLHTYDNAGRLTCEQLITENRSHGELAALFNSGAGNSLYTGTGDLLAEYRYDNYPAGAPGLITTEAQLSSGGIPFSIADVTTYNSAPRGLKTWERLAVLEEGAGGSIERFYFYDNKGRPVQVQEKHDGGQLSYTGYRYDFVGNVLETYERSQRGAGQYDFLHTVNRYDSRNRLLSTASSLNGGDSATVRYAYDDLGRLSARTYGNEVCREVSTYDIQGRLLSQSNPHFAMTLRYDNPLLGTLPSYTGNISEWEWRQGAETPRTYAFRYDGASRLKEAWVYTNGTRDFRFEERGITYDGNGNILTLSRTDQHARAVDDLHYTYTGNRLTALNEQAGDFGQEDLYERGGQTGGTYAYDGCGNLTTDSRRGLNFSYNSLNLLSRARKSNGEQATYSYSADGQKRKVIGADGRGFLYRGSMLYRQEGGSLTLESAAFAGGRFYADGNTTVPYYFLTDHLGNVRALLDAEGTVREQNDYYPFGAQHKNSLYTTLNQLNRFKFGGKEMQTIANLGFLDFGARQYDQLLVRWFTMDPLAEKYYSWSPYNYTLCNPIIFIDPNGMDVWEMDYYGRITWKEESEEHTLHALDKDGVRTGKILTLKDRLILDLLADDSKISIAVGTEETQSDMIKTFLFAADNTNAEWRIDRFDENGESKYSLGTLHNPELSPSAPQMGHTTASTVAFVHSHPDVKSDIKSEVESMGWWHKEGMAGDAFIKYNTSSFANVHYYTYFPNSGRLWSVEKGAHPHFIRNIKSDYKRFLFGTINTK